jgi:WD40 repeat protein
MVGRVVRLTVAPNDSWLASIGNDDAIRVWNLADNSQQAVVCYSSKD